MQELIASYLVQKKECTLPLLGNFRIVTKPAKIDVANKQMLPPTDEILFNASAGYHSDDLVEYISEVINISRGDAEEKFNNWCLHSKAKLDAGEKITFNAIGSLQKNEDGIIFFQREKDISFYETVPAERAIHKNDEHDVLVGDKETTSAVMNEYYRDEVIIEKKSSWKIWAIVLFGISLLTLFFYFYNHSFSKTGVGNRSSFPVKEPAATYYTPK